MTSELEQRVAAGDQLRDGGDFSSALAVYQDVLAQAPTWPVAPYKLATVLARMGRAEEAESRYREALALDEYYAESLSNLAILLVARGEWDEAERCYRRALAEKPEYFEAHVGFAKLLLKASRPLDALYFARRACTLNPSAAVAFENAGIALQKLGRIGEALLQMRRATELDPAYPSPWITLGMALQSLGRHTEADAAYATSVAIDPTDPLPYINHAFFANYLDLPREEVWQRHRQFGVRARQRLGPVQVFPPATRPRTERRLKVGFVSGDLRRHSVAFFVRGALERMDRSQFQLFAYFDSFKEDEYSAWLKPIFHQWRDIFALSDQRVMEMVREDRIDILVDLSGHTGANRLTFFGLRPAPVQVNYLGCPNTTGLDTMDYRLTDAWADPEGDGDQYHSEELWRLTRCFLCYAPPIQSPAVLPRQAPNDGVVVFGSFNQRLKLSDRCVDAWVGLLQRLPRSRLVLKSVFGTEDEESRADLRNRFVRYGIDAARIEVHSSQSQFEAHLDQYGEIDIALDTFPYNGTTTTCEALWMGVPVVSLVGDRHAARVGCSLLESVGLGDLVAHSVDDYIRIAAELSVDRRRLEDLRRTMRDRLATSALFDRQSMGRDLGKALREMWQRHCESFDTDLPLEEERCVAESATRLYVGGGQAVEGWKVLDTGANDGVDYVGDVRDLSAFGEGSCAEIYAANVLERMAPQEMLPVLNGLYRILVPGGRLYLVVPDMDILCVLFADSLFIKSDRFQLMRIMFGSQATPNDVNRIGLSFDFMVDYLAEVGFSSVEHVESFGLFADADPLTFAGHQISLNLLAIK